MNLCTSIGNIYFFRLKSRLIFTFVCDLIFSKRNQILPTSGQTLILIDYLIEDLTQSKPIDDDKEHFLQQFITVLQRVNDDVDDDIVRKINAKITQIQKELLCVSNTSQIQQKQRVLDHISLKIEFEFPGKLWLYELSKSKILFSDIVGLLFCWYNSENQKALFPSANRYYFAQNNYGIIRITKRQR